MSNLSELLPSGGGQNAVEFTASGAVASGKPVILNSDGTVTEVAETTISSNVGTETTFESAQTSYISSDYDSTNNKILIVYRDGGNSGYGTAVVGTISGTSISFGTPVVFASESCTYTSTTFDTNAAKFLIVFTGTSEDGKGIVGTVSGTSVSFGSSATFDAGRASYKSVKYNASEQKSVVAWKSEGDNRGRCRVATISGTSVSFGGDTTFETSVTAYASVGYDSVNQKTVIFWQDTSTQRGRAVVGTISGTTISYNTEVIFSGSTDALYITNAFDESTGKFVVSYRGTSNFGQAAVGTVSGTDISFGTAVTFKGNTVEYLSSDYDATAQKVVIAYRNDSATEGQIISGKVSGTTITFDTEDTFKSGSSTYTAITYDSNSGKNSVAYTDNASLSYGDAFVYTTGYISTNLTAASFIGLASAAISDTASGDINVKGGINEAQTGLTIGSDYYVQNDGSLAATSIPYDISSASYDSVSFSVTSQDTEPVGLTFNTDGTKMFIVGTTNDNVYEYALSTAYDISSASYTQSFSVSSQDTFPTGVRFNNDGTKMFVVGGAGQDINEYGLSSAFDISSASYTRNFSTSAQETAPNGLAFNTDGTKMFVSGGSGQDVNEYSLSTGFDLSSVTFTQNFSVSSQDTLPREVTFNSDGTKMYIVGSTNDSVFQYNLTTGFDLSTASYADISFSLSSQDTSPEGIAFNSSGTKMYIVGDANDSVYQYSTTAASTTVKVGQAISATTINMMDLT